MIAVRLRHLPPDSATNTALHGGTQQWGIDQYLLANIVESVRNDGEPHPARPPVPEAQVDPGRTKAINKARKRAAKRREDIANGLIT